MINNTVGRSLNRIPFHSIFKTLSPYITSLWKWPFLADILSNSLCLIGCQTLLCPSSPTSPIFYWIRFWNFSFFNVTEKYIKAFLNIFNLTYVLNKEKTLLTLPPPLFRPPNEVKTMRLPKFLARFYAAPSTSGWKSNCWEKKHSFPPINQPKGQIWNNCSLRYLNSS